MLKLLAVGSRHFPCENCLTAHKSADRADETKVLDRVTAGALDHSMATLATITEDERDHASNNVLLADNKIVTQIRL
jgi:hypothetical protein